jgi:hypothetical protein
VSQHHDLSAEQIAAAYELHWDIENSFAWWRSHWMSMPLFPDYF